MNSKITDDAFTRTRNTWLTLTCAGALWLGACVWAFSAVDFDADTAKGTHQAVRTQEQARLAQVEAEEKSRLDSQAATAEQRQQATEAKTAELARIALEAEEQARFDAQGKASERRRVATEEKKMAALKAKALAEQNAKRVAEVEELARQEVRAEATRLAAAAKAEEQSRLAAEAKAAEQARLAAEAKDAEQARLAAEAKDAEQASLAAVAKAAEQRRLRSEADVRQRVALESEKTRVDQEARNAAAAEASRIAALARQQRGYNSGRDQELRVLEGLSSRLRFAPGSATVSRQTERILDDIFNPLYLYSELSILVSVATNEYDGTTSDGLLSRDRGRAIASYLINRGLEKERFRIRIESEEQLSVGTHRVSVSAEEVRK